MSKKINCFGFNTSNYFKGFDLIEPYQFIKIGSIIYIRFENADPCSIIKVTKDGDEITQEWAYGSWSLKTSLTYKPINETIEIPE